MEESIVYNLKLGAVYYLFKEAIFNFESYDGALLGGNVIGYTAGRFFGTEPPENPPGKRKGELIKRVLDKMPANNPPKQKIPVKMVPESEWRDYIENLVKDL